MKKLSLTVLCIAFTIMEAVGVDVNTTAEKVTIYHQGAAVMRSADVKLRAGVNELVFKNLSSRIVLNTLKIKNREITIVNRSIVKKLSPEQMQQLLDKKSALKDQLELLEFKFKDPAFVSNAGELETMMQLYSHKSMEIKRALRAVDDEIAEASKLNDIQLDHKDAAIVKITVSVERAIHTRLDMQYIVGGVGWSPAYEIIVERSSDKTIQLKYMAKVMSQTGEDWNNVQLSLSSSFPLQSPTQLPKPSGPWVINGNSSAFNQRRPAQQFRADQGMPGGDLDGVEYEVIRVPSSIQLRRLKGLYSLKSNGTVFSFPILKTDLPANYYHYGFPALEQEAYLVARVGGWDTLGLADGVASITFNDNDLGKTILKFSESTSLLTLPISRDNSVYLKRAEIADQKYFKVNRSGKKHTTTLAYEYTLKNNNSFPVRFELADQVPVAQIKSAEVEVEESSGARVNKVTGDVIWYLDLKPGETVRKELVFTMETDARYRYNNPPRVREEYQSVRAPKF